MLRLHLALTSGDDGLREADTLRTYDVFAKSAARSCTIETKSFLQCLFRISILLACLLGNLPHSGAQTSQANGETIVMVRHGEKPPGGLGQLTCKGLNRALALPSVLIGRFGKPDYIYAPNPSVQVNDGNSSADLLLCEAAGNH